MCVDRKLSLWSHQHSCKSSRIVGVGEMVSPGKSWRLGLPQTSPQTQMEHTGHKGQGEMKAVVELPDVLGTPL